LKTSDGKISAITPTIKAVLLLIGVATAGVALLGIVRGSVYCKGGPFLRAAQPFAFGVHRRLSDVVR
jgi:hypothetical protein